MIKMELQFILLLIIFVHTCHCHKKLSPWWESLAKSTGVEKNHNTKTLRATPFQESKLFKELMGAMQPLTIKNSSPVKEKALELPMSRYITNQRSDPAELHRGVVFMKQMNLKLLEDILYEVSDPHSPHYGNHLSHEEVTSITTNIDSVHHVVTFFKRHGFKFVEKSIGHEFIVFEGKISHWESIFNTEFFHFQSGVVSSVKINRAKEYNLPNEIRNHVHAIFNIVDFPDAEYMKSSLHASLQTDKISSSSIKSGYVTPQLINTLYDVRNNTGSKRTSQGVYEAIGQSYSPSDLTYFQNFFNLPLEEVAVDINGHKSDLDCRRNPNNCVEANLDVQYLMAISQNVPTTYYYWSGQDFMLDWITEVSKLSSPPSVISISYGADESLLPASYIDSFNIIAMKLGVRGITIVVSSGDDGALSTHARKNPMLCGYQPSFPASSPFVTAVGGTSGPEKGDIEVACQGDKHGSITTGGGFSVSSAMPKFQENATMSYFSNVAGTNKQPFPGFNRNGRGYPDVSLIAHNYVIALNNNLTAVSGTSASSPVFGGMIALINSQRLRNGKTALGWINPALYTFSSSFVNDITSGENNCVAMGTVCCSQGYHATPGWDPVTGLGSVNFTAMNEIFSNLGTEIFYPTLSPTSLPINAGNEPSAAPTVYPTPSPSQSEGWMYLRQYDSESCGGEIVSVSGIPTNICMVEYDENQSPSGSRKFVCVEDSVELTFYSDNHCDSQYAVQSQQFFYGCAVKVEDTYYSSQPYSVDLVCSQGRSSIPPLPTFDGSFVLHSSYDDTEGCLENTQSSVDAYLQNYCFNVADEKMSYMFEYPKAILFDGLYCSSTADKTAQDLNTECTASSSASNGYYYGYYNDQQKVQQKDKATHSSDDQYYYQYYDQGNSGSVALFDRWSKAINAPSDLPSITLPPTSTPYNYPTLIPTTNANTPVSTAPTMQSSGNYHVFVSHYFEGITERQWGKCSQKCFQVVQYALTKVVPGLYVDDVNFVSIDTSSSNFLLLNVSYEISASASQFNAADGNSAAALISTAIESAANNGNFDINIQYFALAFETKEMIGVKTSTIQTVQMAVAVDDTDSQSDTSSNATDSHSNISTTAVISSIVVFIVILTVIAIVQFLHRKNQQSQGIYSEVSLESDSVHASKNPLNNGEDSVHKIDENDVEMSIEMSTISHNTEATKSG